MEGVYDWQKPLEIPRHDEPEAEKRLQTAMEQAVRRSGMPMAVKALSFKLMDAVQHPDTDAMIFGFLSEGRSQGTYGVPLRVEVFPQDSIRRRRRAFIFQLDGAVCVVAERNPYHEDSPGHDMVEIERIQGWPEGVRHMCIYVAKTLRASSAWELKMAEELEVLAPLGTRSGFRGPDKYAFIRGKLAGEEGLEAIETDEAYLRGHKEGRTIFILSHPAMR
ncbi:hypothetical protein HZC53_01550 [Candidatus Uhrbacteria bacterium]|nr:hypothetical protein [Candidatus Uhrbacteria bacterium]